MKKLMLLSVIAAMITTTSFAQGEKEPAKDPKKDHAEWEKKLKAELKLTEEQTVKFDAISKEYAEKIATVMQDASLSKDAQKEKKMALKKEKETKLMEVFTPEQQTKYKELIDKKKKEMEASSKPAGS